MSFNKSFINILKIQSIFGLTPFRYNKTSKKFELNCLNSIQSLVCYFTISTSVILCTILYQYNGETNLNNTANWSVFSQDAVILATYNGAMINLFFIRKDHVHFLNKLTDISLKMKIELSVKRVTSPTFYRKCFYLQISNIAFSIFLLGNEIGREVQTERFKWSTFVWTVLYSTEITAQTLILFYIGCLTVVLIKHFEIIFLKLTEITNIQSDLNNQISKDLIVCINLFEELIFLKDNFSKLFGHQLLLIFFYEFVNTTISIYFILLYSIETSLSLSSIYLFLLFVIPHILMLIFLIHFMHKLADVVNTNIFLY